MFRIALVSCVAVCLLAGCGANINNKEQVRADIMDHLAKNTGLELKSLDIDVTKVSFDKNQAKATVTFRPKGISPINDGMVMIYALESKNGHWVIVGRSDSQGHGLGGTPTKQGLPPGHPPVNGMPPGQPGVGGGSEATPNAAAASAGRTP